MALRRKFLVGFSWLLLLFPLPSCGEVPRKEAAITRPALLSCLDSSVGPDFLEKRITATLEGMQLLQVIDHLHAKLGLPVSFVQGSSAVPIDLQVENESVRSFLERLLDQARDYRCAVIENHVVIFFDEPALHKLVDGVSITRQLRGQAARSYVEHVSRQVEEFQDLAVLLGGPLEADVFTDVVSLARESTMLEHLCQLLGANPKVFFGLRYASVGGRYLTFGSVP